MVPAVHDYFITGIIILLLLLFIIIIYLPRLFSCLALNQLYPWFSCLHISVSIYVMVVVAFGSAVIVLYSPLPLPLSLLSVCLCSFILYYFSTTILIHFLSHFSYYPCLIHTIYIPRPLAALRSTSHSNNSCCLQS